MRDPLRAIWRYIADLPRFVVAGIAGGLIVLALGGGGAYVVYVQKSASTTTGSAASASRSVPPIQAPAGSLPQSAAASPVQSLPSPSPTVMYQPPAASAARASTLPPMPEGSCRVPLSYVSEANGGFLIYPGGQYQPDPNSIVALPGNTPGAVGQNPGLTYDFAIGKWVPVPFQFLAPGGQTYAYEADYGAGKIRAVTVADGTSGDVTTGGNLQLIGVIDSGVYAGPAAADSGAYYVPFGGQPQQVVGHGSWSRYDRGALWGADTSNNLVRYDLTSGVETTWGHITSVSSISGFDASGEPVVYTGGAMALHHQNGSTTTVWPGTSGLISAGYVWGDSHGLWFEVDGSSGLPGTPGSGIYLWSPEKGATRISDEPAVHVMGPCQ